MATKLLGRLETEEEGLVLPKEDEVEVLPLPDEVEARLRATRP